MKLCRTYGALGNVGLCIVGCTHAYTISPLQGFFLFLLYSQLKVKLQHIIVSSMNLTNSYNVEKHEVEEALKERHLKGQSDRAVIMYMRDFQSAVGATPIVFNVSSTNSR